MKSAYIVEIWGEKYGVRGDWGNASSSVEEFSEDGWHSTGRQVADFCHSPKRALRAQLGHPALHLGTDDIDNAMKWAHWE